ncbi:hypothetical protein C0Q87_04000 [Klebsiella aerogenes]|nr:hypothetical protein CRN78_07020 [Klebsiella aerogenes]ATX90023.1 hypothetical protein AM345_07620 [Klebsiella aerogenes]ATY03673.1 hypothetical protein AM334_24035 [Klebsiella aerogenes]ATY08959.1 hypothetical protein AM336_14560 [Klebsiella aerogenes]AUY89202.1 hypothetical protein AL497_25745 [Klebsiella aerogenes]
MHADLINRRQRGVDQLPLTYRLHPQFWHFPDSIHQICLSIKAVFDWTFNIKCVLIVADLLFNSCNKCKENG